MRRGRAILTGVLAWTGVGAIVAGILTLAISPSGAFAASGGTLTLGSIAWAVGPFKTPMVWTEGALVTYQGNAEQVRSNRQHTRHWQLAAVPAFACAAGALLLIVAGVLATQ